MKDSETTLNLDCLQDPLYKNPAPQDPKILQVRESLIPFIVEEKSL